jgi:N-acyl-D-amino-acid deacylase
VLARIDSARAAGLDVTANLYPYIAAATSLDASIPAWAHSGGVDSMLLRLQDPATRARIRTELTIAPRSTDRFIRAAGGPSGVLVIPFADSLKRFTGKRLSEVAALRHKDPYETLFNLVIAERARTGAIYFLMSEPDVRQALATWWTGFDTDYGGVAPDGPFGSDGAHPRSYGTFPRILGHYVRDERLMPLEFAVRKATSLPAQRVGLTGRGLLKPGFFADITVFDPATIIDRATFENPHQPSAGIVYVLVNGRKVLDHGKLTSERPGRGLRGPGYIPQGRRER